MGTSIAAILAALAGLGYALWRKHKSPEAELARRKEREKADKEIDELKAEQLEKDYARFEKLKRSEQEIEDRLNHP